MDNFINVLIDILTKKKIHLSKFKALTEKQSSLMNEDGIEAIQEIVSEKQTCITFIDELDVDFGRIYSELKDTLGVDSLEKSPLLPKEKLKQMQKSTKEVMDMLYDIQKIDSENLSKANELKDNLAMNINKLSNAKKNKLSILTSQLWGYFLLH